MSMQYFHPDNMSSAEKMKLELAKVRDEFKMSDSDCGSARVQGIVLVSAFWSYNYCVTSLESTLWETEW